MTHTNGNSLMFRRCSLPDASLLTYVCTVYGDWDTMFVIFKLFGTYRCLEHYAASCPRDSDGHSCKKVVNLNHFSNYNF